MDDDDDDDGVGDGCSISNNDGVVGGKAFAIVECSRHFAAYSR